MKAFAGTTRAPVARASRSAQTVRCAFETGQRVRVVADVKVSHVGKFKQGLELKGMEGTVTADVRLYKGQELSATMPWKVQFEAPAPDGGAKPVKVIAHLDDHEIEAV